MQLLAAPKTTDKPIPPMGDEPVKKKDIADPFISTNGNENNEGNDDYINKENSHEYKMLNYSLFNYL